MRTSCPWSTMRILTPQPQLGRLLRFLYANGAKFMELLVRFERTGESLPLAYKASAIGH